MTEAPIDHSLPDLAERVAFLFPDFVGEAEQLDDETVRLELIEAEHPTEREADNSHRVHTSMHLVVANQVLGNVPAQVWPALRRIVAKGYSRHDAIHMVAVGVSNTISQAMKGTPQAPEVYLNYLASLPAQSVRHPPAKTSRTGGAPSKRRRR